MGFEKFPRKRKSTIRNLVLLFFLLMTVEASISQIFIRPTIGGQIGFCSFYMNNSKSVIWKDLSITRKAASWNWLQPSFGLLVDAKLSNRLTIESGILITEEARIAYSTNFPTCSDTFYFNKPIYTTNTLFVGDGILLTKMPVWLTYRIIGVSNKDLVPEVNQLRYTNQNYCFLTLDILTGINLCFNRNNGTPFDTIMSTEYNSIDMLNDTIEFRSSLNPTDKKYGLSIIAGLNIKLNKKDKEIMCLSIYFEQGITDFAHENIYITRKNEMFYTSLITSGTALMYKLSFPINISSRVFRKNIKKASY